MRSDYALEEMEVGAIEREVVQGVRMPRSAFLDLVDRTFARGYYSGCERDLAEYPPEVRVKLTEVAKTMPVFPIGRWVAPTRGCGCVVGEYMVAADLLDRRKAAKRGIATSEVESILKSRPDGEALYQFGLRIDEALMSYLDTGYFDTQRPTVIVFDDEE